MTKKICQWTLQERRKRGGPPRRWKEEVEEDMAARGLQERDRRDHKIWKLRSDRRRQPWK